jgi:hypothetical protein
MYIYIQTYTHTYYWSVSKSLESSKSCIATTSSPRLFEPSPHEVALLRRLWTARQCAHVQGARPAVISAIRRVGLAQQRTKKCWTSKKTMAYPSYIAIYIHFIAHIYRFEIMWYIMMSSWLTSNDGDRYLIRNPSDGRNGKFLSACQSVINLTHWTNRLKAANRIIRDSEIINSKTTDVYISYSNMSIISPNLQGYLTTVKWPWLLVIIGYFNGILPKP